MYLYFGLDKSKKNNLDMINDRFENYEKLSSHEKFKTWETLLEINYDSLKHFVLYNIGELKGFRFWIIIPSRCVPEKKCSLRGVFDESISSYYFLKSA